MLNFAIQSSLSIFENMKKFEHKTIIFLPCIWT